MSIDRLPHALGFVRGRQVRRLTSGPGPRRHIIVFLTNWTFA